MADSQINSHFLNPWVLHLQKLGLELKCSLCLNVYNKPMLLPCDHIFCCSCVPKSNKFGLECPLCKSSYVEQDLRQLSFVENVVNIYKSLDASFSMHMLNSDFGRSSEQCSFPAKKNFPNQLSKGLIDSSQPGNSTSGTRENVEQYEAIDMDTNHTELSPHTSSGASKGVDIDNCDPGSGVDTAGKCRSKKSSKRTDDDNGARRSNRSSDLHCKKQKQLNRGQPEMCPANTSAIVDLQNSSCTGSDINNTRSNSGSQQIVESDHATFLNFICAFCQTWKITEGSGPMQHFANGRQVFGSDAGRSNVIHVHQSCTDWAPQTYYVDDNTMKNLDKELARAGKLKCTRCGLKGAALGCLAKSCRRSYHAPCAYEISECRWDTDNFLMLCPAHASHKFPSEKSKKPTLKRCLSSQSHQLISSGTHDEQKACDFDFWATSPTGAKKWVLCGSALCADEKHLLVKFANMCGVTVAKTWNPNVTHVIAAIDDDGACSRTLKVLMAILNGKWILSTDWILACLTSKRPVGEQPFEISLDNHGCYNGPMTGRLRFLNNEPKLFDSMKFFFNDEFVEVYKNDLQNLIIAAGGIILLKSEELQESNEQSPSTTIIVYNEDATGEIIEGQRQLDAEKLALESESQVIGHTWILDSIASGEVKPFVQRLKIADNPWV